MRISGISITDTYGCKHFKVGSFTALRVLGQNGSGKSSILRALGYLFSGGTSPDCIRKGAEQSIVELLIDDGTRVVKTTRPKRARKGGEITGYVADLEITQSDGSPRPAPQSYINELSEALAIDPSILLRIDATTTPGRRALAAELMKLVPISFAPEEVQRACSYRSSPEIGSEEACVPLSGTSLSLDDLKKVAISVTERRRREGQTKGDTDGAINRLQKALPEANVAVIDQYSASQKAEAYEAGLRTELEEAEEYRRKVESAIAETKLEIEKRRGDAIQKCLIQSNESIKDLDAEIDAKISDLEALRGERFTAIRAALDTAKGGIEAGTAANLESLRAESRPELDKAIAAVTEAKGKISAHARAATLREEIEVQTATHRSAAWKYDQLSEVLQRLESLRLEKLQHLPVAGLVVEDGCPYLDGIAWQNVNLARRVEAILQICCMQTGKLPLILWDDCEHADSETRAAIEQGLIDAGYQVICAQVTDSPLSVETLTA